MINYKDFSIRLESKREEGFEVKAESAKGDGTGTMSLPDDAEAIVEQMQRFAGTVRSAGAAVREATFEAEEADPPHEIGERLFHALFNGSVATKYYECYGSMKDGEGVRIKLHFDFNDAGERKLALVPWEYLFRPDNKQFLNLSRSTPIVRYIESPQPIDVAPLEGRLQVLVIISSPTGVHALDLEKERANIEKTFASQSDVDVDILENPTAERLQDKLSSKPYHVLHYMGHGAHDADSGIGALIMEDDEGNAKPYDAVQLGMALGDERRTLRLVFLNACDTAKSTEGEDSAPFGGVAAALVQSGVTAVLAMQFPISDSAAIAFSRRFYKCIAKGYPVDHATAEGRKAIVNDNGSSMEWGTPVLFMRAPDGRLFDTGKGAAAGRGVLETDTILPDLDPAPGRDESVARTATATTTRQSGTQGSQKRSSVGLFAALGVAVVAAAGVALYMYFGGGKNFKFEHKALSANLGENVDAHLSLNEENVQLQDLGPYTIRFSNFNAGIVALDESCKEIVGISNLDCVDQIDGRPVWKLRVFAQTEGTAKLRADIYKTGEQTPVALRELTVDVALADAVKTAYADAQKAWENPATDTGTLQQQLATLGAMGINADIKTFVSDKTAALADIQTAHDEAMLGFDKTDRMLNDKIADFDKWARLVKNGRNFDVDGANGGQAYRLSQELAVRTNATKFALCTRQGACAGVSRFSRGADVYTYVAYEKFEGASEKFSVRYLKDGAEVRGPRVFYKAVSGTGTDETYDYATVSASGTIEVRLYNGNGDWIATETFTM